MTSAPAESDLWQSYVGSLRLALEMRKPDAIARIRLAVEKLDGEISANVLRREIRARAGVETFGLDQTIELLAARMDDLRGLAGHVRSSLLDHDANCTPEAAMKANEVVNGDGEYTGEYTNPDPGTDDLSDELKRAANDIRSGWMVITRQAGVAISGRSPGGTDIGTKSATLAEQYFHWIKDLHRRHKGSWVFDDVVCEGLSRAECAVKRRCGTERVWQELVDGLRLYAETYPPLGDV